MRNSDKILGLALQKLEPALDRLGIEHRPNGDSSIGILCPVHGSTDCGSSTVWLSNGYWKCWSYNCEKDLGSNVVGLMLWVLTKNLGRQATLRDLQRFLMDDSVAYTRSLNELVSITSRSVSTEIVPMDPSTYPTITTPSKYFVSRGFSPETLNKFGVGDCRTGFYSNRAIVPIKFVDGQLLGFSARSHYSLCPKCKFHHSKYQACIHRDEKYKVFYRKWLHSKNSQKSKTFYNIENVKGTDKVAIVEGPSCVWRLDKFEIPAIACLGKDFNKGRKRLLKSIGIEKILFLSDNDEAGNEFKTRFIMENYLDFQIYVCRLDNKDPTEMTDDQINKTIVSMWKKTI